MDIFGVISLFGGLALFLYGMHMMGDSLQRSSGSALKKALEKATSTALRGFILGLIVTCVIQSSTATIVLTVGLVSAGMLTFRQSISIVIGANVGTTVTAQLIRLLDINESSGMILTFFKPATLAPVAIIIAIIFIMFTHNKKLKTPGEILMGFGILFTGLLNMTAAAEPLATSQVFYDIMDRFSVNPFLGFLTGMIVTSIVQSSSASIGILQALCISSDLAFKSIYSIIIGVNIGTCVTTAIVCSIGAKAEAKRTVTVHILFNVFGSILVIIGIIIARSLGLLDSLWDKFMSSGDVANIHTLFKLCEALILLPFVRVFEKLSFKLVKDDKIPYTQVDAELATLDTKLFGSPALALASSFDIIRTMCHMSTENVFHAFELFKQPDEKLRQEILDDEVHIDRLADGVDNYLIHLSSYAREKQHSDKLNYYIQCFSEFERIGDFAVNLVENSDELHNKGMAFSEQGNRDLENLSLAISEIIGLTNECFKNSDPDLARHIEPLEEVIDEMVELLKDRHIERLRSGKCAIYSGLVFLDVLTNVERIADHCSNIAVYTLAQTDDTVMTNHHDYIKNLHQGNDPFYIEEFRKCHDKFFNALL